MSHRPFAELRTAIAADPEQRARVEAYRRTIRDALALAELRTLRGATQEQVAHALGVGQENVARIERQDDLYLSALGGNVAALGGRLEVSAVFPNCTVALVGRHDEAGAASETTPAPDTTSATGAPVAHS